MTTHGADASLSPLYPKPALYFFDRSQTLKQLYFILVLKLSLDCNTEIRSTDSSLFYILASGFTLTWILLIINILFCLFASSFLPGLFPAPFFHTWASQAFPYSTFCTLDSFWACRSSKLRFYFYHSCSDHVALSTRGIAFRPLGPLC